jgi:hypothetical protein
VEWDCRAWRRWSCILFRYAVISKWRVEVDGACEEDCVWVGMVGLRGQTEFRE